MWHYSKGREQLGPIEESAFQELVRTGVVTQDTFVWRAGMVEWQPLKIVSGVVVGAPLSSQMAMVAPVLTNGNALTSMILGISAMVMTLSALLLVFTIILGFPLAIAGVVFGHVGRRQIRNSPIPMAGEGMAMAGLILSYLVMGLTVVGGLIIAGFAFFIFNAIQSPTILP